MPRAAHRKLDSKTARLKLKPRSRPYFTSIERKLLLGYVRQPGSLPGRWVSQRETERDENGYVKRKIRTLALADDYADADGRTILSEKQARAAALERPIAGADSYTTKEAAAAYLDHVEAESGTAARKDAKQRIDLHVLPVFGDRRVGDITAKEWKRWRDSLVTRKKDPVTRSTANRIWANTKAMLNLAKSEGLVADDAEWRGLKKLPEGDTARKVHFDATQVQRLVDAARAFDAPFADFLTAGFLTGARPGELAACDVAHFDAKAGVLAVPSGKTGARAVTLMQGAIEFFSRIVKGRDRSEPLLVKAEGERWGKSQQKRRMDRALQDAELPAEATFYSMRHSFISRAIEEDVPVYIIARNCGTSERMIRKHYAHLFAEKERHMLERAAPALRLVHNADHAAA